VHLQGEIRRPARGKQDLQVYQSFAFGHILDYLHGMCSITFILRSTNIKSLKDDGAGITLHIGENGPLRASGSSATFHSEKILTAF